MIGSGLRGGDACEVRGVFRSSILAAVGCPIGREEQAARVCRWDASMQGMLVYTLQGHFCRDTVTSGEGREKGNSCTSKQCKITMAGKAREEIVEIEQNKGINNSRCTRSATRSPTGKSLGVRRAEEPSR